MILVVGATGQLGGLITRHLLQRGEGVRVLVRQGASPGDAIAAGAHRVAGDLKDRASLRSACEGVDTVITTANATARGAPDTLESVDRDGNANLIEVAETAGVRRFLFISALGADPGHPLPLLSAKGVTERRLRSAGMAWIVFQPNVFMDKLIPLVVGAPALAGDPVTLVGAGDRRHSFVAMRDVAAYVVGALDHEESSGRTLVIGGPQPVSWRDVVTCFETELGRTLPMRTVSPQDPPPDMPAFLIDLLTALDGYDSPLDMNELQAAYGVEPTPLAAYVRSFLRSARPLPTG